MIWEYAGWIFQQFVFVRLRHVAMPVPHRNAGFAAEVAEPQELVVYQRLQRADVDRAHRMRRIFGKQREYREERSLRLS